MAFVALSFVRTAISPLRGYFLIMLVVVAATAVLDPLVRQTTFWTSWFGSDQLAVVTLFAERVLLILTTLIVLGALLLMGLKRRQLFLVKGHMDAPALKLPGLKRTASWRVFGPVLATLLSILYVWFFAVGFGLPTLDIFVKALPFLPLALLAAAINALGEEMMYRAAPLSQLLPVVGAGQALLMTSIWFGLGHYYGGIPSGMAGLVFAGSLATLFGKAMLDTRGMTWPWVIHFLADAVIYTFLTLAMVAP
jgi:membrane protease YdiL (CAAX protease family)